MIKEPADEPKTEKVTAPLERTYPLLPQEGQSKSCAEWQFAEAVRADPNGDLAKSKKRDC